MPSVALMYGVGLIPRGAASPLDGKPLFGALSVALESAAEMTLSLEQGAGMDLELGG